MTGRGMPHVSVVISSKIGVKESRFTSDVSKPNLSTTLKKTNPFDCSTRNAKIRAKDRRPYSVGEVRIEKSAFKKGLLPGRELVNPGEALVRQ
jgi:hypothetical protein